MAQELADVVARPTGRHAEDLVGAEHDARLRFHQGGGLGVVDHGAGVLGHLELHVDALVVAHLVAQVLQAHEGLLVLGLGEGAQRAGDPGRGRHHVDRGAGVDGAGAADAVGLLVAQPGGHVAQPVTSSAVARMTSPCAEGMAPCPPGPVSVMRNELASDMAMPARRATKPEAAGRDVEPDEARALHGGECAAFEHRLRPAQRLLRRLEEEDVACPAGLRGVPPAPRRRRAWSRRARRGRRRA